MADYGRDGCRLTATRRTDDDHTTGRRFRRKPILGQVPIGRSGWWSLTGDSIPENGLGRDNNNKLFVQGVGTSEPTLI
jgi:hypothetical protein